MPSSIIELGSALLAIKDEAEYLKLKETHSSLLFNNAWDSLTDESQAKVLEIIKNNPIPDIQSVVKELIGCETLAQLQQIKMSLPIDLVKDSWGVIESEHPQEAKRIKELSGVKTDKQEVKRVIPNKNVTRTINQELIGEIRNIKQEMNRLIDQAKRLNDKIINLSNQLSID